MLRTDGLTMRFGEMAAVDNVSLAVGQGAMEAIIGPNGAGKTTFLNMLSGYYEPSEGEIYFRDQPINKVSVFKRCRSGLARTFQQPSFFPALTAAENVQVSLQAMSGAFRRMFGNAATVDRDRALAILERVGLAGHGDTVAENLSYGDQRRLEIGIALGAEPDTLLLDEPMAGMSGPERESLSALLRHLHGVEGLTVVFTEHDMDVVFSLAQRVHVFHQGALLASGAPDEIRANSEVRRVYLGEEAAA